MIDLLDSTTARGSTEQVAYRVGFLVDGLEAAKPVRDLIAWAHAHPNIDAAALVIHRAPQHDGGNFLKFIQLVRKQGMYVAVSRTTFAALATIERKLILRGGPGAEYRRKHPVGHLVDCHLITGPVISSSGYVYRFTPDDLEKIVRLKLDLLVRCGSGILRGGILSAARHGVISFHHADNRVNRGGPAGFWEVLRGEPVTGFIVQRLTDELDGGEVLYRGSISTALLYTTNQVALYERSNEYMKRTIERLAKGQLNPEQPQIYDGVLYRTPLLHETMGYVARTALRIGRKVFRRLVGRRWNWGVAYQRAHWCNAVLRRGQVLRNPPGCFLADPFAFQEKGAEYVFVEEYSYRSRKGVISAYHIDGKIAHRIGVVLEENYHLSFPFVFRHNGTIYMVPESSASRSITLYRCSRFPDRWERAKVLMTGVCAVDSVIFSHEDRWWLLTTIKGPGTAANDAELHAFWADEPTGEWQPHSLNPVIMNAEKGRNGGMLRDADGGVYRVAQRHSFNRYGASFSIHQITELSPTAYEERLVQHVQPGFFKGIAGTHHMHESSGLVVYDFVRDERPR